MNSDLSDESLVRLSDHLALHMGINFSTDRLGDLKQKMVALAEAFEFDNLNELSEWLLADRLDRDQIELLADFLTVGETYFFRDPRMFAVLEEEILPNLIQSRQQNRFLRIWSAACCTGEEPYSIAMLVRKLIPDIESWQIKILATDINRTFLEKAQKGIYGDWSFRGTPDAIKEQHFKKRKNNRYQIAPEIRKMVQFEWMNLAEADFFADVPYSGMDIILCRNVLIYFSIDHAKQIVSSLNKCLIPDGYLFLSPNELPVAKDPAFKLVQRDGVIFLQKKFLPDDEDTAFGATTTPPAVAPRTLKYVPTIEEAQAHYDRGDYVGTIVLLLERCQSYADFSSMILLARAHANQGDLQNALKWCDQAIKVNRLNAAAHYLRSTILQEQNAAHEAVHSLRQALLMDTNFVVAHLNLGILLSQKGKQVDAQTHFGTALQLLGNYADNEILPESDGTTASGMRVIVSSLMEGCRQ
ncbi:MAG TPA: CheR family methyltransferase [Drouetiella sp.]